MTRHQRLMRKVGALERLDRIARLRRYLRGLRARTGDHSWAVITPPYYADGSATSRSGRGGNWRAVVGNKAGQRRRLWYAYFQYWRVQ